MGLINATMSLAGERVTATVYYHHAPGYGQSEWGVDAILSLASTRRIGPGDSVEILLEYRDRRSTGAAIVDRYEVGGNGVTVHLQGDGDLEPWPT